MRRVFPVDIGKFYSISEISSFVDGCLDWYQAVVNEYDQRLGELLRKPDGSKDEELLKKLSENMNRENDGKDKKDKKGKKSESATIDNWYNFKGVRFSAESKSIVETFFEAADVAKKNLERLKEVKTLVEDLQKIGFPEGLVYSIYFVEGIPQRVYIEKEANAGPRYKFEISLSTGTEGPKRIVNGEDAEGKNEAAVQTKEKASG